MKTEPNKQDTASSEQQPQATPSKPGFFTRVFGKLDSAMKQKAEAKAAQGCCCSDGKGGKC